MNVTALNSSPNLEKGGTALLLEAFLEGMKRGGAETETYYLYQMDIKPCRGCFRCWFETPGHCFQKDDVQMLLEKIAASDVVVLASPVYVDGMTGVMKTLIDRMIPLVEAFFQVSDNHCRHPLREHVVPGKVVLVSVCGFTEVDNFDPLIAHVKAICKNMGQQFAGALVRPYGSSLPHFEKYGISIDHIFEAARQAGYQLAKEGKISEEFLEQVKSELVPREQYIKVVNDRFQRLLDSRNSAP
ncbi:MAG: flavodoxin family protein [Theionarchaea archaeon]|nr:flavodoxin family protein [Theionarchaea archaeon]MBU6999345.1 flavodoxin family protein [Theionarchaea archaeon]MBU7021805.1 flavodoxin family protein [Theionarchaea archaeon]MBU7034135.1 flavodoxin family protein [Theionarchaea archaeon]MBU7040028.1 flavodoxin family protein [Theionarchaea archaeon]